MGSAFGVIDLIDIQRSGALGDLSADSGEGARWGFKWKMFEGYSISPTSKEHY